ncbi:MAG: Na/Pi symporter [bacterium]
MIFALLGVEGRIEAAVLLKPALDIDGNDISGNNQIGVATRPLHQPLRVVVLDSLGAPVEGVLVEFNLVEAIDKPGRPGCLPTFEQSVVVTNAWGIASSKLTAGSCEGYFHVVISPKSTDGNSLIFAVKVYRRYWLEIMLIQLVGGLALFLFGIRFGGRGLQKAAGGKLRDAMCRLTNNRVMGLLTGVVITVIIQSSSATTAMLVSFANAGIILLRQALGVILGADIGTTLTVQLIAFRIFDYALIIVAVGFVILSSKVERYSRFGQIIMAFGLLFFGMSVMSKAVEPVKDHPAFIGFMLGVERNTFLAIVAAAIFTAIIQGSAATIGLVLTFAFQGLISLRGAIPLVLGANIGTCATALLASIGSSAEGKRIAYAHIIFKVVAVAAIYPFLDNFTSIVQASSSNLGRQIANAHSLFNIAAALAFVGFVGPWDRLLRFLIKEEETEQRVFRPVYLDPVVLDSPSLALGQATRETLRMADISYEIYSNSINVFINDDEALREKLIEQDDKIDMLEEAITPYLTILSQKEMSDEEAQRSVSLLFIVKNLELIGDIVSKSLMDLALKKIMVSPRFSREALERINQYHREVQRTFQMAISAFASQDKNLAEEVVRRKSEVNKLERELHKEHLGLLHGSREEVVETSTIYLDVINDLKRVNSLASGIAYAVLGRL